MRTDKKKCNQTQGVTVKARFGTASNQFGGGGAHQSMHKTFMCTNLFAAQITNVKVYFVIVKGFPDVKSSHRIASLQ